MSRSASTPYAAIFALFLASGATSLVYEVVWLRQLILIFGSTQFATSTILSTFMGGLALGAFLAGRRLTAGSPLRIYGWLEIAIGLYALIVPLLFRSLSPVYQWLWNAGASDSFVTFSLAKFVGIAIVLLPPTVLMGASLPVLARQVADDPERIGGKVGGLYAINVFGAVLGVFVAGFVAIPGIGVRRTVFVTAAVNGLIGLAAILLAARSRVPSRTATLERTPEAALPLDPESPGTRLLLLIFALSGFGALVLEVAWTRVLSLIVGSSVYAFSLMLLAFLIGLAIGGAFFSAWLRRRPATRPARLLAALLIAAGLLAYASSHLLLMVPRLLAEALISVDPGPTGWLLAQFLVALLVMFPATFALGGIFPTVLQLHARRLDQVSGSVGTVYAANTGGTILGAGLAGFLLIPSIGVLNTIVFTGIAQLILGLVVLGVSAWRAPKLRTALGGIGLVLGLGLFLAGPEWNQLTMNSGVFYLYHDTEGNQSWDDYRGDETETITIYEAEGMTAHIFVAEEPKHDNIYLSVNGKVEASTQSDLETQLLAAHLPLLVHPDPKDVMVIGLASGISAGSAATHPVDRIHILEIEKKMVPAARKFEEANGYVLDDPRVSVSFNDARNELEFSEQAYDVVISEPSNPWMTIAANLFTEEFFQQAARRMKPGGIYCQWVQNYFLPTEDLRSVIAAFQASFPNILLFEVADGVDLLMLGSQEPLTIRPADVETRMAELSVRLDLERIEIRDVTDLLSSFRLGDQEVRRLVKNAPRNTDDNARVEFSAPKSLGLETIGDNTVMLRQYGGNLLDYFDPPLTDPERIDGFRLALAEALMRRGDFDLAVQSVREVSDGPLRARADRILSELDAIASGI